MTYKELLEMTMKHPNPFWNREQHEKDVEFRFKRWQQQQQQQQPQPQQHRSFH